LTPVAPALGYASIGGAIAVHWATTGDDDGAGIGELLEEQAAAAISAMAAAQRRGLMLPFFPGGLTKF
jgi:hypothetical protein